MLITKKSGNINNVEKGDREIDLLPLEWHETGKRILHKCTVGGRKIVTKFLQENQQLRQGDVLAEVDNILIVVDILPCEVIVIAPASMEEMGALCYEIGNRHLPVFMEKSNVLIPYEDPLFNVLQVGGYKPEKDVRKLVYPIKTTISPHDHRNNKETLFTKILNLTTAASHAK